MYWRCLRFDRRRAPAATSTESRWDYRGRKCLVMTKIIIKLSWSQHKSFLISKCFVLYLFVVFIFVIKCLPNIGHTISPCDSLIILYFIKPYICPVAGCAAYISAAQKRWSSCAGDILPAQTAKAHNSFVFDL